MLPRNLLGDTWLVFCRVMLPVVRNPVAIVFGIAQPLLYLGLFGPLLGEEVGEGGDRVRPELREPARGRLRGTEGHEQLAHR